MLPTLTSIAAANSDWTMVQKSPLGVTATMVFVEGLQNMERMATVLGKTADAALFKAMAAKSVQGYTAKFHDAKSGGYGTQCGTAMPLALGVANDPAAATKWLVDSIGAARNHSLTGEIGWPYLVRAFSTGPEVAVLQAMLHKTDAPSYLYQYYMGATTLTEQWDADRTASWNHAMDGHVDGWLFEHVAGLKSTGSGSHVLLAPQPVPGVTWASTSRSIPGGIVTSRWDHDVDAGTFRVAVTVPPGSPVRLRLPTEVSRVRWSAGDAAVAVAASLGEAEHVRLLEAGAAARVLLELAPGAHVLTVLPDEQTADPLTADGCKDCIKEHAGDCYHSDWSGKSYDKCSKEKTEKKCREHDGVWCHGPSPSPSPSPGGGQTIQLKEVTFYGFPDNCPPSAQPHSNGTGTFANPITFAGAPSAIKHGTLLYIPHYKKYFIMDDECEECEQDWKKDKTYHMDLWLGPTHMSQNYTRLVGCEDAM